MSLLREHGANAPADEPPPKADAGRLVFIDQLRALAALYVVVYHALLVMWPNGTPRPPWYLRWADFGHVGVAVFIVLSGCSLALGPALHPDRDREEYGSFMRRRAWRLLPPYWIVVAGSVLLLALAPPSVQSGGPEAPGDWGKGPVPFRSVLVFGGLVQDVVSVPSPNSPLWSIAVEWHLYFLFPLLIFVGLRYGMAKLVAAAVVIGLGLHYAVVGTGAAGTTPHFLALFCMGIAAAHLLAQHPRSRWSDRTARIVGWGLVGLAFVTFAALATWEVGADLLAGALVASALYLLGSARSSPGAGSGRTGRALVAVGLISYSLYLVHAPTEKVVWKLGVSRLGLSPVPAFLVLAVAGMAVALLAAWVLHLLVERPSLQRSRAVRSGVRAPVVTGPEPRPAEAP